MSGGEGQVRVERDGDVAVIVLVRPDRRNALTPGMFERLNEAVGTAEQGDARALLLAGEGPAFCGGFDLKMCLDQPGTLEVLLRSLAGLVQRLRAIPKPVVIAAHGAAIAGGCALLAAADYVVADEGTKVGYPVVPLGISPAVSAATLRLAIGDGRARERLLDPALISGAEAARIGLVHEVVKTTEEVRPRALDAARGLAAKPAGAFAATKIWMNEIGDRMAPDDAPGRALAASLGLVGSEEERSRLQRMFRKP